MNEFISTQEAARRMGVSEDMVRELCKEQLLLGATQIRERGPWIIPVKAVKAWIEAHQNLDGAPQEPLGEEAPNIDPDSPKSYDTETTLDFQPSKKSFYERPFWQAFALIVAIVGGIIGIPAALAGIWADADIVNFLPPTPTTPAGPTAVITGEEREVLVLISEFEPVSDDPTFNPSAELEATIEEAIIESRGEITARVLRIPQIINSHDDAQVLSEQYQATLVMWGRERANLLELNFTTTSRWSHVETTVDDLRIREFIDEIPEMSLVVQPDGDSEYVLWMVLAQLAYFEENYEQAELLFDKAITLVVLERATELGLDTLYFYRGNVYSFKYSSDEAIRDFSKAIQLNPEFARAYNNRGNIYWEKANYEAAIKDYTEAIRLNPHYALALYNRGNTYKDQGNYEAAIRDYSEAVHLNPRDAEAYHNRGITYISLGDYEEAIDDFSEAIRLNPKFTEAYYNRGLVYTSQAKYEEAIYDFTEVIRLNPQYSIAYYNRGVIYVNQGFYEEALDDYSEAIRLNPQFDRAYNNRGNLYLGQEEHEKAINDFSAAIRFNPELAEAYYNRGLVYTRQANYEVAITDYTEAIRLNPQYSIAYFVRGFVYQQLDNIQQAEADFAKARELGYEP